MDANHHINNDKRKIRFLKVILPVITAFMYIYFYVFIYQSASGKVYYNNFAHFDAYLKILLRLLFIFSNRQKPFKSTLFIFCYLLLCVIHLHSSYQ